MYTSLDGRRGSGLSAVSGPGEVDVRTRLKRWGIAAFVFLFVMLMITRNNVSPSSSSSSNSLTQDDDDDNDGFKRWTPDDTDDYLDDEEGEKSGAPFDEFEPEGVNEDQVPKKKTTEKEVDNDDYDPYGGTSQQAFLDEEDYGDTGDDDAKEVPDETKPTPKPTVPKVTAKPTTKKTSSPTSVAIESDEETGDVAEEASKPLSEDAQPEKDDAAIPCESVQRVDFKKKSTKVHLIDIPRSGATPVATLLKEWGKKHMPKLRAFRVADNATALCPKAAHESPIIIGRGFGFCPELKPSDIFSITVLRGPMPRIAALYDAAPERFQADKEKLHVSTVGKALFSDLVHAYNATPEIEPGEELLRSYGSDQARYLCGYQCTGANPTITDEQEVFTRAKANLQKLGAIGLMEDINTLAPQLTFYMPTLLPKVFSKFPKEKENIRRSVLDEKAKAILSEWAAVDKALYTEAKLVLEKRLALIKRCADTGVEQQDDDISD